MKLWPASGSWAELGAITACCVGLMAGAVGITAGYQALFPPRPCAVMHRHDTWRPILVGKAVIPERTTVDVCARYK